jgi:hypothetical protein
MTAMTAADALVALVRANQDVSNHGPGCSPEVVRTAEGELGVRLPPSYRRLVEEFGAWDIAGEDLRWRENGLLSPGGQRQRQRRILCTSRGTEHLRDFGARSLRSCSGKRSWYDTARRFLAVEISGVIGEIVLSLVRSDATGEMELRGSSSQFKIFAAGLRSGGDISVSLDDVSAPSPYDRSLFRMVIRSGSGKVVVSLMDDGQSLLVCGGDEFMAVLADNIGGFAEDGVRGEHAHIEYFPGHYYLAEEAEPLVLALE